MSTLKPPRTDKATTHERSCCGVIQDAKFQAREKRAAGAKPQPWAVLKLMVLVTFGIIGYASYVYIGRFCVRMIRRSENAAGGRGTGIALLIVFSILLLWMLWAYVKVIFTPPGYARDYVQKSPQPLFPAPPRPASWQSNDMDIEMAAGQKYQSVTTSQSNSHTRSGSIGGPSYETMTVQSGGDRNSPKDMFNIKPIIHPPRALEPNAGTLDALPHLTAPVPPKPKVKLNTKEKELMRTATLARRPPTTPVLRPEHRYCSRDEIVKPFRTHHCRACGTCVLKYDHHCPWIGQCVGARNHKFFVNFVQAAFVFTVYTFVTLLVYNIRASTHLNVDVDPQQIVIIALAATFLLFTSTLLVSHIHLIWRGQTTVESMQMHHMKERESTALSRVFGCWEVAAKSRTRRRWDDEWGAIETEGNIWWLGDGRKEWKSVMGESVWSWILPIGRSQNDGLAYPVNPRFDDQGRWRRRAEWPEELQL